MRKQTLLGWIGLAAAALVLFGFRWLLRRRTPSFHHS
ncbi:MAG: hypothetical protein BWX98_00729 [Candidatus Aminicenantes bacterium ADurb.Bin147]|nr:MAG: hypothetical protein BWX98_00729 [Candidatus Aminicenantes bacterium ADurb.Bin147]